MNVQGGTVTGPSNRILLFSCLETVNSYNTRDIVESIFSIGYLFMETQPVLRSTSYYAFTVA